MRGPDDRCRQASVEQVLAGLEALAAELGDAVVLDACRRFLADPQRGFRAALDEAVAGPGEEWPRPIGMAGWPTPRRRP